MAVKKILTIDKYEKFLKTPSQPVKRINKDVKQLIKDLKDTMADPSVPAIGLSAPQIGVQKRVFAARMAYEEDQPDEEMAPPTIFINPEIIEAQPEVERGFDACLSIPGMMGYTDRNVKIKVRYQDEAGKEVVSDFEGWDARVIQHEIDHLDGILFLQRLASLDDLYVYVKDKEGNHEPVPYNQVVKAATAPVEAEQPASVRLVKDK